MSASTKKKHVISEIMDDDCVIHDDQQLVEVLAPRGNHLYEVKTVDCDIFLVSMPSKFRNTVWIKGGSYVIIELISEGKKVKGEIVKILLKHHVKLMKRNNEWPAQFQKDETNNYNNEDESNFSDISGDEA